MDIFELICFSVWFSGLIVRLKSRIPRFESTLSHGSLLDDFGPVIISQSDLPHRVVIRIKQIKKEYSCQPFCDSSGAQNSFQKNGFSEKANFFLRKQFFGSRLQQCLFYIGLVFVFVMMKDLFIVLNHNICTIRDFPSSFCCLLSNLHKHALCYIFILLFS